MRFIERTLFISFEGSATEIDSANCQSVTLLADYLLNVECRTFMPFLTTKMFS